jgi:hypothetical protein
MKKHLNRVKLMVAGVSAATVFAVAGHAQNAAPPAAAPAPAPAAAPAPPAPLSTFVLSGPLTFVPPANFDAGPFGKLSVNGVITGYAMGQNNPVYGDDTNQATITNGSVFIQKADGELQYFVQAGLYDFPTLGVGFANAQNTTSNLFGPVPVAWAKIGLGKTTNVQIGELPTLIGAEGVFTFQNMNVSRGLLWNQENIINRGVQINQTIGKYLTAAFSWNDGYYSDRYNWLSGNITFVKGPSTLSYTGMGNYGKTNYYTNTSPVPQDNSQMHNVIYTFAKGSWIATGTYQFTLVPANKTYGYTGADTQGFAAYVSKSFKGGVALPIRFEYMEQSGTVNGPQVSLLYGPGSSAWTFTATPTWQKGGFFFRSDLGFVDTMNSKFYAFGPNGTAASQFRATGEFGFIFGDNITKE